MNCTSRLPDLSVFGLSVQVVATDESLGAPFKVGPGVHPVLIVPDASEEVQARGVFAYLCQEAAAVAQGGNLAPLLFGMLRDNPAHFKALMQAAPPEVIIVDDLGEDAALLAH